MNIKYFDNNKGQWADITGNTGDTLTADASGWGTKAQLKSYIVSMNQSATAPPQVYETFENTIGNIVWTRSGTGDYLGYLLNAFIGKFPIKEGAINMATSNQIRYFSVTKQDNSNIRIQTWMDDGSTQTDDVLKQTTIEIKIY